MRVRVLIPLLVIVLYGVVPFALAGNNYVMSILVAALIIAGVALAWALLGNLGGMVSFGHAAFFGVGSYISAIVTMKLGVPVFAAMLLGGAGAAVAAVAVLPALRLSGPYFALAVLAYAHIFKILATEFTTITGGAGGILGIPTLPRVLGYDFGSKVGGYLVIVTIVLLFALVYARIRNSYYGYALRAMHDSEDATRVVGVHSTLLKALMLFLSAFMTGVVGAFNAHCINFLEPDYAFSSGWTMLPVVAAIFGGYRTLTGPLVGAVVVYTVDQLVFKSLIPSGHQIIFGVLLGVMILFAPDGLIPLLAKKLQWVRQPRGCRDPRTESVC
ncbi:branched-chain amino acid ABC transporter permease [Geobacter sp.]|uniref:branched-chain amino acid ABC transporter permease n=1 Tax=Geobacter sp. TaxID=46610 RepID=UPI0026207BAF|nr:branched-chain amino acid ABC transporter permease [Geobacter sp.]